MALTVTIPIFHTGEAVGSIEFVWSNEEEWIMESLAVVSADEFIKSEVEDTVLRNRYEIYGAGGVPLTTLTTHYEALRRGLRALHDELPSFTFLFPDTEELPLFTASAEGVDL